MILGGRASLSLAILFITACSAAPAEPSRADSPVLARVLPKSPAPPILADAPPAPPPPPPAEPQRAPEPEPEPAPRDDRPRIGSIGDQARIWRHPEREGLPLGYIRAGTSVLLASPEPVEGKDCSRGYYKVEPRGYVCLEPRSTTLDLDDPYYRALAEFAPRPGEVWPYRYAFSNGAPMYSRVPAPDEAERAERGFGPPGSFVQLAEWSRGHEELIDVDRITATDPVPDIFAGGRRKVSGGGVYDPARLVWRVLPNGSMISYARAFEAEGRVWLVTPDLMLVPADRVRPFRRSAFHGARLGEEIRLPIAWNRATTPRSRYAKDAETGEMIATGEPVAPKRFVQITGPRVVMGGRGYFEIRGEPGTFVAEDDVTVTRPRARLPQGVSPGQKWIEARIVPGTMTAYEGLVPVYATLFSPGKGGAPIPGFDPYKHSMTKTGFFPIEWKDRVTVMSPDKEWPPKTLWFSDVPNIQYLRAPLAMHVSYWHEDFGNPKSAECLNVSPEDGHFLFGWTDPPLPEGWAGVRPGDGNGPATPVVVTAI